MTRTGGEQSPGAMIATFAIVTPVLNGAAFLDQTILSVVSQAGPFTVRYHVQDAGSTDGTLGLLERWSKRLATDFPILCSGIEFSFSSEPDRGVYDGINKGFKQISSTEIMSWINADDIYYPGAFASVAEIFKKFGDVDWIGGRPVLMSETGQPGELVALRNFPRKAIAAGIFDGRFAPWVLQQEGMFWRAAIWKETGGLDGQMKLAGDFDLWRRFARLTDFVMADALLGVFRLRRGQLSGQIEKYYAEVDGKLTQHETEERNRVAEAFRSQAGAETLRAAGFGCRIAVNRVFAGGWHLVADAQASVEQLERELHNRDDRIQRLNNQIAAFGQSRWVRLGAALRLTKLRAGSHS